MASGSLKNRLNLIATSLLTGRSIDRFLKTLPRERSLAPARKLDRRPDLRREGGRHPRDRRASRHRRRALLAQESWCEPLPPSHQVVLEVLSPFIGQEERAGEHREKPGSVNGRRRCDGRFIATKIGHQTLAKFGEAQGWPGRFSKCVRDGRIAPARNQAGKCGLLRRLSRQARHIPSSSRG